MSEGDEMKAHGISDEDCRRVTNLRCEIVNFAYHENYEASDLAARELVELVAGLEAKYGPLPSLLAIRAEYATSSGEQARLLHAAYEEAERRGDFAGQAWAAHSLASHYVEGVEDEGQASLWLSRAEAHAELLTDELAGDELARLRSILVARQRRKASPWGGGPPNSRMQLTRSARGGAATRRPRS
jgi:hypothetical protein